jgi:ectoine hydroxylase-related dioxygenase (phytanoyl-CoA dioxygenase family)
MSNIDVSQLIREINAYGYTIIPGGNPNYKESLDQITLINKKLVDQSNKSLHAERSADNIVYNLQNKHENFVHILRNKYVEQIAHHFLSDEFYQVMSKDKPNYILSYYNARSSGKFLDLHIDTHVPAHGDFTWAMQAAYVLEDMDEQNGCTVVVPGSHMFGKYTDRELTKRIPIIAKAGDIVMWDSRLWHGTLDNISGKSRWVLIATFTRWWVKQSMDMTRGLPQEIYDKLDEAEKLLLGFCSIPPSDETGSIHTKKDYSSLLRNVTDYYKQ